MWRHPALAATVVATLGFGIATCTAVFSLGYGILARPFPYFEPDRLVRVLTFGGGPKAKGASDVRGASLLDLDDWERHGQSFARAALYVTYPAILGPASGPAQSVRLTFVTSGLFSTLGVAPILGRDFTRAEDTPGGDVHKVIVSHALWQSLFASDTSALGRTIRLRGATYEVIGVMPKGFRFPDQTDLWVTLQARYADYGGTYKTEFWNVRDYRVHTAVARLRQGLGLEAASAETASLASRLAAEFPDTNEGVGLRLQSLREAEVGALRPYLMLLFGAVALVLLIACSNVATLLLAEGVARSRELAVRVALGAGRARLVRMLLAESVGLGLAGGLLGVLLSWPLLRLLMRLIPVQLPFWMRIEIDPAALAFGVAAGLLSSGLSSLVPAWRSTRAEIQTTLRDGGRGASGGGGHRTRRLLVAAQTALALVLLVGAGLMTRSFLRLLGVDAGLRTTGLVAVYVSRFVANTSREASVGPYTETYDRVMARLRELPRVIDVGGSYAVPFKDQAEQRPQAAFSVEGQDRREQRQNAPAVWTPVSPSYFETLGIPLLAGRTFRADDTPTSEPVVIVNRSMAKTLWPGREAVGQMLLVGKEGPDNPWNRVVGVVGDTLWNAAEGSGFEIYSSHRQWPVPAFHILVRVDGDPRPLVPLLRRVVQEVEPDLAVNDVKTMDTIVSESLWQRRLWGALLSAFGVGALLLGALGLYSVTSQAVGERTRELGVRMALGARARDVLALVAGEAMGLALAGAGAGVLGALALSQFLRGLLFEVAPTDPLAFGAASGLLVLVALVASLVPAARAARVDPAVCLRRE